MCGEKRIENSGPYPPLVGLGLGGERFDLPRHSHYSGVIPMVFQHVVPRPRARTRPPNPAAAAIARRISGLGLGLGFGFGFGFGFGSRAPRVGRGARASALRCRRLASAPCPHCTHAVHAPLAHALAAGIATTEVYHDTMTGSSTAALLCARRVDAPRRCERKEDDGIA